MRKDAIRELNEIQSTSNSSALPDGFQIDRSRRVTTKFDVVASSRDRSTSKHGGVGRVADVTVYDYGGGSAVQREYRLATKDIPTDALNTVAGAVSKSDLALIPGLVGKAAEICAELVSSRADGDSKHDRDQLRGFEPSGSTPKQGDVSKRGGAMNLFPAEHTKSEVAETPAAIVYVQAHGDPDASQLEVTCYTFSEGNLILGTYANGTLPDRTDVDYAVKRDDAGAVFYGRVAARFVDRDRRYVVLAVRISH